MNNTKTKTKKQRKVYKVLSVKLELSEYNAYVKKCTKNNWLISQKLKDTIYKVINQD